MAAARIIFLVTCFYALLITARGDDFYRWFDDQREEIMDAGKIRFVQGEIPDFLVGGNLFRGGPTVGRTAKRNYSNFVDFFGRVSKWSFVNNSAMSFQSSILKSSLWNASNDASDIPTHIVSQKTEPDMKGIVKLDYMDNTDVYMYAFKGSDKLMTFTDFYEGNVLHAPSMRTIGNTEFADSDKSIWSSSHAAEFEDTYEAGGDTVLVNWIGTKSVRDGTHMKLSIYKMGPDMNRKIVGSTEVPFLPYSMHSVSVVGHYAVVQTGAVGLNFFETGLNDCISCSVSDKLATDPTRIWVFDLRSSKDPDAKPVSQIEIPAPDNFFSFHHINAVLKIDTSDSVVVNLDLCIYKTMDGVLGEHVLGNLNDVASEAVRDSMAHDCDAIRRVELDITHSSMVSYFDFPVNDKYGNSYRVELASNNPAYREKPYCYVYAPVKHFAGSKHYADMGIIKINLCLADLSSDDKTVTVVEKWGKTGVYVGEPLFVPHPDGKEEDDGVVLVITRDNHDGANESSLMVLNGKDLTVLAQIDAPFPLPFEFHGRFFEKGDIVA